MNVKKSIRRGLRSLGYELKIVRPSKIVVGQDKIMKETSSLGQQLSAWGSDLSHEVEFWNSWFASKGLEWPDDFIRRQDPDLSFDSKLLDDIAQPDPWRPRVLDVGAGPMTKIGKIYRGEALDITAVDPLAPFYSALAERYGVFRPVVTQQGFGECLSAMFEPDSFDLVSCTNALDHSIDPVVGIEEMLIVVRIGGKVALEHAENEASANAYEGVHQWNFTERAGSFVIWNKQTEVDVTAKFAKSADVSCNRVPHKMGRDIISVTFRKRSDLGISLAQRHRRQIVDVLSSMLLAFYLQQIRSTENI
jgi:SAM-dependent methyltransferase